ncbi:MAG: phosphotransferase family protein [Caulobacterales bacterium]
MSAEPVTVGLFGQNVFLTTTAGAFVFRGAPHWHQGRRDDGYQFAKEAFFIHLAHESTAAPVPWPCHYDPSSDIFGWPYLVMPRMPGTCFNERSIRKKLEPRARREVAVSMGATLADLNRLCWSVAGDFDVNAGSVAPEADGYRGHLIAWMTDIARRAEHAGVMTEEDMDWIAEVARRGGPKRPVTFVHGDFKLDNVTVAERDGCWRVTGVFDFHTARFGDGASDIVRQACAYCDTEPELAWVFVDAWRSSGGDHEGLASWLPLYVASERVSIWSGFVKADARPAWARGHSFRSWSEQYLEAVAALL